jgi:hypothetical protein
MPAAIGLRFYKLVARRLRDREKEDVSASELSVSLPAFFTRFVGERSDEDAVADDEKERSYYFEPLENYGLGSMRGHVHYGTFGFESRIKRRKSKVVAYERKSTDVEEIPLYFDFWCPPKDDFAMASSKGNGKNRKMSISSCCSMRSWRKGGDCLGS